MAKGRVIAAMSGGVDSSVAAALLVEQGFDVIGVTMRLWSPGNAWELGVSGGCCSLDAVEDARRVADKLDIPYYVLNFSERFKETVVDYFVEEYRRGRTPNPCIACNRHLKFNLLLEKARSLGADYVATGHYAGRGYSPETRRYLLYKGRDSSKDQSYALYTLTQRQLKHTLFPLQEITKEEVREYAAKLGLVTASKPESQEICFVPDNDYKSFWEDYTGEKGRPGPILTLKGEVIGQHKGIHNYTIGQRRGLGVQAPYPLYVIDIVPERNAIVVGRDVDVYAKGLVAEDLNWISIAELTQPIRVEAKIRYTALPAACTVFPQENGTVKVVFDDPVRAVTPGQAVVFYDGELVVGGGTIASQIRN